ncbi:hypothetical protein HMSSN036_77730 [Paenibacillus macerans]|nr:hypothetical protein HMSSN036_77730 [Paenibacillus macerans]
MLKLQELQRYMEYIEQSIARKLGDVKRAELNVEQKKSILNGKMLDEKVWLKAKEKSEKKNFSTKCFFGNKTSWMRWPPSGLP